MTPKEHVAAANALIQWFNSQDIDRADACAVMSKVIAKILVGAVRGSHTHNERLDLETGLDLFTRDLVHDMNDHLFATRPRNPR